ncbi:MAG: hypothetical protein WCH61_02965 [bacterium]
MKKAMTIISIGLLFILSGCIPSVHPLYTEQDLIFDPLLVGEWVDKDGKETWTFTKSAEKTYTLRYIDEKGKTGDFVVHLLQVGINGSWIFTQPPLICRKMRSTGFIYCRFIPLCACSNRAMVFRWHS